MLQVKENYALGSFDHDFLVLHRIYQLELECSNRNLNTRREVVFYSYFM